MAESADALDAAAKTGAAVIAYTRDPMAPASAPAGATLASLADLVLRLRARPLRN